MNDHQSDLIKYVPPKCEKCGCEIVNLNSMCVPCAVKQAEPVAWMLEYETDGYTEIEFNTGNQFSGGREGGVPLYTHPAQPVQPAKPVKFAKYFALADVDGKHIKKNYFSGQLEIYEEENQVPCSHKETLSIAVYVTKTAHPPPAAINEQMLKALRLIRGKHVCGALTLPEADLERTNAAIAAAEAEKAKGGNHD